MSRRHTVVWTAVHVVFVSGVTWLLLASGALHTPLLFALH